MRDIICKFIPIFLIFCCTLLFPLAQAEIINVPDDFETIQAGIDESEDGDTILVHPGTYVENINFVGKAITVASLILTTGDEAYIDSTIIDGNESGSVVRFDHNEDEHSILIGFNLTNGSGSRDLSYDLGGGGIHCLRSSPTLSNLTISENSVSYYRGYGGGVFLQYSSPEISHCQIISNLASRGGGGLYISRESNPVISYTTIANNSGGQAGGSIGLYESCSITLINVTFANNINADANWDILLSDRDNNLVMINCILWDDFGDMQMILGFESDTVIVSYSNFRHGIDGIREVVGDVFVDWQEGNIDEDPLFINPDEGDYHLTEDSPCIDAGTAFFVWEEDTLINMAEDQYQGFAPDMGAFESEFTDAPSDSFILHPSSFILFPAYPNPFNSTTTISYTLPSPATVMLGVYDLAGRRVSKLIDGYMQAGFHNVTLNAGDLPSGIYIVHLETADRSQIRKIALIR